MKETTKLIRSLTDGDPRNVDQLMPLVYEELKAIAKRRLNHERNDHTLQPTALVNEAFLRMAEQHDVDWQGKAHFCGVAAKMMRRILVDHARQRNAQKRQSDRRQVPFQETLLPAVSSQPVDIVALDDLLEQLAGFNPRQAQVFELRCFGGLEVKETAEVLKVSPATVKNDWRFARAWLASQIVESDEKDGQ